MVQNSIVANCAFLVLFSALAIHSKVFNRCELARIFLEEHNFNYDELGDWLCLVAWTSGYNSSYYELTSKNGTHNGLFVLGSKGACSDEFQPYPNTSVCGVPCSKLREENLTDAVQCARLVVARAKGFSPWWHYNYHCKGKNNTAYLAGCQLNNSTSSNPPPFVISPIFIGTVSSLGVLVLGLTALVARGRPSLRQGAADSDLVKQFTLPGDQVTFDPAPANALGEGHFGLVHPGEYNGEAVALKTTKGKEGELALRYELKVLALLNDHPHAHIIRLVGVHMDLASKMYIVVELCPLGTLHGYLEQHRHMCLVTTVTEVNGESEIYVPALAQFKETTALSRGLMLIWSMQIVDAMEYLTERKVIHGDLAARNVLLKERNVVKLTDFGLSKKLYEDLIYLRTKEKEIPWRWLPPEALTAGEFSSASDVWSFGVTLWEIYSLAAQLPFASVSSVGEYLKMLQEMSGPETECQVLEKPVASSDEIYAIMSSCWALDPAKRPSFAQLRIQFWNHLAGAAAV